MMTQYTHTISKEEISLLEIEEFPGRIIVIDTEKDADKAVEYLLQFEAVGFDTETRPSFKKGTRYKISLMQISTDEACFLFRLNRIGIPQPLEDFMVNDKILKIGLSLRDDFGAIRNGQISNRRTFRICKIMSDSSVSKMPACKRYMLSFSTRKYRKASA